MRERTEKAVNLEGKRLLDIKELCFYLSLGRNNKRNPAVALLSGLPDKDDRQNEAPSKTDRV